MSYKETNQFAFSHDNSHRDLLFSIFHRVIRSDMIEFEYYKIFSPRLHSSHNQYRNSKIRIITF